MFSSIRDSPRNSRIRSTIRTDYEPCLEAVRFEVLRDDLKRLHKWDSPIAHGPLCILANFTYQDLCNASLSYRAQLQQAVLNYTSFPAIIWTKASSTSGSLTKMSPSTAPTKRAHPPSSGSSSNSPSTHSKKLKVEPAKEWESDLRKALQGLNSCFYVVYIIMNLLTCSN